MSHFLNYILGISVSTEHVCWVKLAGFEHVEILCCPLSPTDNYRFVYSRAYF